MVQLSQLYMPTGKTIALIGLKHHVLLEKQTRISASRTTRVYNLAPLFIAADLMQVNNVSVPWFSHM